MVTRTRHLIAVVTAFALALPLSARAEGTPVSNDQLLMLYFTDSGRSFGYQVMMARIQLDTVKAQLARDVALLPTWLVLRLAFRLRSSSLERRGQNGESGARNSSFKLACASQKGLSME